MKRGGVLAVLAIAGVIAFAACRPAAPPVTAAHAAWAGPAVSWAPSTRLWVAGTAGFGLNDRSADLVARFVISVGL